MQNNWILSGQARASGTHRTELKRTVDGTFEFGDCGLEHLKESELELYAEMQRQKRLKTCYSRPNCWMAEGSASRDSPEEPWAGIPDRLLSFCLLQRMLNVNE